MPFFLPKQPVITLPATVHHTDAVGVCQSSTTEQRKQAEIAVERACHELLTAPDAELRRAWGVIFTAAVAARNGLYSAGEVIAW